MSDPSVTPPVESNLKDDDMEFPIPVKAFVMRLRKTENEVWGRLLLLDHAGTAKKPTEWTQILTAMKQREA